MSDLRTVRHARGVHVEGGSRIIGACELKGTKRAPSEARKAVRRILGDSHPSISDIAFATSEMVTNSVLHSRSRDGGFVTVVLIDVAADVVRVEVIDAGAPTEPQVVHDLSLWKLAESGRGLRLVAELSAGRWGQYLDEAGRTVWAEITPPARELVTSCTGA